MTRRLIGVGVGPGDPDLVTVKAVRVLQEAHVVLVPVLGAGDTGRAEAVVRSHVTHDRVRRVVFALTSPATGAGPTEERQAAWAAAADTVLDALGAASTVAFATLGDPNVYSTFTYLAAAVTERDPDVVTETVPGVMAMCDLAARSGTVLAEGSASLALVPLTAGPAAFAAALASADATVAYKTGQHLDAALDAAAAAGRLDRAVLGSALGLPGQQISRGRAIPRRAAYFSTLLVPAPAGPIGGRL